MDQGSAGCALRGHLRLLLFVGLLLSETQILVNLKNYSPAYYVPYCTLAYFILSTAHLASVFARYALGGGREKGAVLEWYEQLVLPGSVLLLSLLSKGAGMVEFKASCAVMLVMQSLLVVGKIIYFNSVTPELAQISTINKLVRVVKLNVIGLLPLVVQGQLVVVVVVALCQTISLSAFFLKFTYQKCLYEYVLLVGVFCGFVSAVQNVFQTIFVLPYLFIGQLAALFFYLHDNNYLKTLLELKYSSSLGNNSEAKQDDEVLAGLLFLQECLFESKRTLQLSESAKNEGALHASAIMDRIRIGSQRGLDGEGSSCDMVFRTQSGGVRRDVSSGLFEAYCLRFHQTDSFSCFEFTVGSALQLGGGFTSKALMLYYSFMERKRVKASVFEHCKFHYIYQRILKQVEARESDREDINFIEFSDNLRMLGGEIEDCVGNELKLVEYLADRGRKAEMMTDARIFARNKLKQRIRSRVEKCISQKIYFCSNEFKFLFLLYHISIEKRYLNLREQLKHHFLASEVQQLRYSDSENSLIVLSGFNHGQIINSNEVFKSHFGLALSSFARSNISEFIPTEKQRAKHAALMAEAVESRKQQPMLPHFSYECLLAIEREMGSVKLKVVEGFKIGVRIHYENSGTFNYICSLAPFEQQQGAREKQTLTLLRRDCQNFTNKGILLTVVDNHTIEQLDEQLELTEIDYSYESLGVPNSNNVLQRTLGKERTGKIDRYLQEKTLRIEMKMMEEGIEEYRCGWSNIIQITAILLLAVFVLVTLGQMGGRIDNLKLSISKLVMPVAQAELVHSKILLEQEILSLQAQTPYFADNLCLKNQLPSISSYVTNILYADLQKNTDDFISALSLPHNFGPLGENLYIRKFSSMPYRMNPLSIISYQKHIQLMKSQTFSWLSSLRNKTLDYSFYSQIFPGILLNSTIDGPQTLTSFLQASQNVYIADLTASLSELRAISLVLIGVLGALAVGLRLRDNRALMSFLCIVECIPAEQLGQRIRELKSAISQLHQMRANRIEAIEFDHTFTVEIKKDKLEPEGLLVEEFAEWHMREKAEYELEDSEGSCGELDKQFEHHRSQEATFGRGQLIRLLRYKKGYLLLSIGLLVCVMALSDGAVGKQRERLDTLVLCSAASLQLSTIQQKFINLAAYNWLKVLSLQQPSFDMTQAKTMYLEAISSLYNSTYITKIPAAYSKQLSDQILFGDVCSYFNNRQACLFYRNNIFSSGLSMVIPFVVKEMVEIDQLSSNYSYYLLNMCDKTWLLFDGIVPLTNNISAHGFKTMTELSEEGFLGRVLQIILTTLLLLIATVIFQYRRYRRERIVREEVFSLDTVENLYAVAQFKPYFNGIYYS